MRRQGITRRSFLKFCSLTAASLGLAPVFAALAIVEESLDFVKNPQVGPFLPVLTAQNLQEKYQMQFSHAFAALPQYDGQPAETGMLAQYRQSPLLQDLLRTHQHILQSRLIARLFDLLDSADALVRGDFSGRVQCVSGSSGEGLSTVRTARGMLMHRVVIEAGQVADYLIVAPTEWNFHPQGIMFCGLTGMKVNTMASLLKTVNCFVLSLDPCVEYEIEVEHA
jgi:Ni,Fe-hydrogenase I large subunit